MLFYLRPPVRSGKDMLAVTVVILPVGCAAAVEVEVGAAVEAAVEVEVEVAVDKGPCLVPETELTVDESVRNIKGNLKCLMCN